MESETMGRVVTEATIVSLADLLLVDRGLLAESEVRRVTVQDALADTGAAMLSLPSQMIRQLGLKRWSNKRVTTSAGPIETALYGPVLLTVQGRECRLDALEVPDGVPVLIGQIPLEALDYVVDPCNRRLMGNPAHGGEYMYDMY